MVCVFRLPDSVDVSSVPLSTCRELVLSIVQHLPSSLIDQDTLSKVRICLTSFSVVSLNIVSADMSPHPRSFTDSTKEGLSTFTSGSQEADRIFRHRSCSGYGGCSKSRVAH